MPRGSVGHGLRQAALDVISGFLFTLPGKMHQADDPGIGRLQVDGGLTAASPRGTPRAWSPRKASAEATGTRLLRFREDRRAVSVVLITLLLLAGPLFVRPEGPVTVTWVFLNGLAVFLCCIINHNHVHVRMGRTQGANRIIALLLTMAKGHTSSTVIIPHNRIHHLHGGDDRDWMPNSFAGHGWGIARILRYIVRSSVNTRRLRNLPGAPTLGRRGARSQFAERVTLWAVIAITLAIDPVRSALFIYLPWLFGMAALVAVNLLQHDGCDPASGHDHSRNFVGRLSNWLFFNNGYHTAHHLRPAMHWSLLPEFHRQIEGRMRRPELNQPSLWRFLVREYVFGSGPATVAEADAPNP